jgi:hypothetical protein
MNIENEIKELNAKQKILNFFSCFGLKDDVKHIISPFNKPVITFKPKTLEDYKRIMSLLNKSVYNRIIKESGGTTGFKPIDKYSIIPEKDNITRLDFGIMLETTTLKYKNVIKIKFFIEWGDKFFNIWVECPLNWFQEHFIYKEIVDVFETQTAREYNHKHKEVMTKIPIIRGFIDVVKFWGGHYVFYSVNDKQTEYLKEVLMLKGWFK